MKKNVTSLSLALISVCLLFSKGEIQEGSQEIESFSISLNVKDVVVSKTFYEKLGFKPVPNAGSVTQKWVIKHTLEKITETLRKCGVLLVVNI